MKYWIVISVLMLSMIGCNENEPELPICVKDKLAEIEGEPVWNPPAKLHSYTYEGQTVYYLTPRCCDYFGEVYDANCEFVCAPDGGITGNGDGTCPDFFEVATNRKLVWEDTRTECGELIVIDGDKYGNAPEDATILDAKIEGDCLTIEFGASGCSGSSWTWELIDQGVVMESFPVQRNIKFSLNNPEMCAAYFERSVSFDLNPIKDDSYNQIKLNISRYETQLLFEY